jgi:type VI secretion system Hcp family effector
MSASVRLGLGLALMILGTASARADVQISMTADGAKGPISAQGRRSGSAIKVLSVTADFAGGAAKAAPVIVTKPVDRTSGELLDALSGGEVLHVVITTVHTWSDDSGQRNTARRVVTLTNARIASVREVMDSAAPPVQGLGVETIAFTYDRIEIRDDEGQIYASNG